MRIFGGVLHDVSEVPVDQLIQSTLLGHLLHDVLGGEDRVEVEPLRLHLQPLIDRLLDAHDLLLPVADLLLKRLDERRALHRDGLDDVVVEDGLYVVARRQDADTGVAIIRETELDVFPLVLHLLQTLLQAVLLYK